MYNLLHTICLKNSYSDSNLYARIVWQYIYNWYIEHGGPGNHLDNLLCDYDYLKDKFSKYQVFEFWWTHYGFATQNFNYEDHEWELYVRYDSGLNVVFIYENSEGINVRNRT